MDGLALLCNLHADGPLSLRRLRQAGIADLERLEQVPENALAGVLKASRSQVQRFVREARELGQRLASRPLDSEFGSPRIVPGEGYGLPQRASAERLEAEARPVHVRRPVGYDLALGLRASEPETNMPPPVAAPSEVPRTRSTDTQLTATTIGGLLDPTIRAYESVPDVPLKCRALPGLDARTCEGLVSQGVRTLQALVELAGLPLARRAGIPLTRLLDLRYHARSYLEREWSSPSTENTDPPVREVWLRPAPPHPGPSTDRGAAPGRAAEPAGHAGPAESLRRIPAPETPSSRPSHAPLQPAPREEPGVAGPFV